jgi:uncharacterized protein DUF2628
MHAEDPDSNSINPYASPSLPPAFAADDSEELQVVALRAFVGPNANYYLSKWAPALRETPGTIGMNWAAFFLSGFWFPYRKMYKVALILYACVVAETIGEDLVFVRWAGEEIVPVWFDRVTTLAFAAVCGIYGNRWYLSHATRQVSELQAQGLDKEALWNALSRRGGTSLAAALGMFLVLLLILGGAVTILETL